MSKNIDKSLVVMYQKELQEKREEIQKLKCENLNLMKEIEMLKDMQAPAPDETIVTKEVQSAVLEMIQRKRVGSTETI